MTSEEIRKQIKYWELKAAELSEAMDAKLRGASSASISAGGGTKSYTNYSMTDFQNAIANANKQARLWRAKLNKTCACMPRFVAVVRPGR